MADEKIDGLVFLGRAIDVFKVILRHTKTDPVVAATVHFATGVHTREVAAILREFEKRGFPVCSGAQGYYMAKNEAEWYEHLNKERDRGIATIRKTTEAKKHYVNTPSLFDQPGLK